MVKKKVSKKKKVTKVSESKRKKDLMKSIIGDVKTALKEEGDYDAGDFKGDFQDEFEDILEDHPRLLSGPISKKKREEIIKEVVDEMS